MDYPGEPPTHNGWPATFPATCLCYAQEYAVTVHLPDDLGRHPEGAREALEAFALEGYRTGALTPFQTRTLLGFRTRDGFNAFLKKHDVWEILYTVEDLQEDRSGLPQDIADSRAPA